MNDKKHDSGECLKLRYAEVKEENRNLLAENVDLKIELEKMKQRIQALECVKKLIEGSRT